MATTKKELPELVAQQDIFRLVIPKEVEEKIRHLCRCVPTVEWSGKLFYKTEGSIADKDLVITCVDIYPMDIGSGTYTEFEETPDYFGYMIDKDLMDCNIGLIHSHNVMATFFSGTDTATLREEGNDNNHFVSLIVNNAGVYTAAVTRKVLSTLNITETKSFRTFDDSEVHIEGENKWQKFHETIEWYNLSIDKEEVPSVFNELDARLNEIRIAKERKKTEQRKMEERVKENEYISKYKGWSLDKNFNGPSFSESLRSERLKQQNPMLFNEEELRGPVLPEEEAELSINEELVENIAIQLVTGSILISDKSNINLDKFSLNMESLYNKRFSNDPGLYFFSQWAENFVEILIEEAVPEGLTVEDENMYVYKLSSSIIDRLSSLTKNEYLDIIIEALQLKTDF